MKRLKRLISKGSKKSSHLSDDHSSQSDGFDGDMAPNPSRSGRNDNSARLTSSTSMMTHSSMELIPGRKFANDSSMAFMTPTVDVNVSKEFRNRGAMNSGSEKLDKATKTLAESTDYADTAYSTRRFKAERAMSIESHLSEQSAPKVSEETIRAYAEVPHLELTELPRGGISMETQAVGRVQFGIPPETIKDSMRLGLTVPAVYIVPVERFCREMGPALGVNLAEFEFPAYFNFFVFKKRCTLVVDSEDAEQNIRRVFSETLLGPAQFRRAEDPIPYEEEDFAPDFPRDAIPNFQKELEYFRIMPDGKELVIETLLNFRHFEMPGESGIHDHLGVPPPVVPQNVQVSTSENIHHSNLEDSDMQGIFDFEDENFDNSQQGAEASKKFDPKISSKSASPWSYSQARWIGSVATVWPHDATEVQIATRSCKRVEIFKMPGGTEYILHDIDENNFIVGKAKFSGNVKVSESLSVDGFGAIPNIVDNFSVDEEDGKSSDDVDSDDSEYLFQQLQQNVLPPTFHPPSFGVTILGNSHGFDKSGSTSGYVLWINGRGVMIDPPPYSSATLEREGIRPRTIVGMILTHCHADHDAGAFQKVLTGSPVVVITTPTIYKSFIRKYAALSALSPALLRHSHRHKPAIIGSPLRFQGATFHFTYTLHTIPCVGFRVEWRGRSMVFTGDHFNYPPGIDKLQESGVLSKARADDLRNLPLQETDLLLHEAGAPPIHTPLDVLMKLPDVVKKRMYVVHTSALPEGCELRVAPTGTAGTIRLDQQFRPQEKTSFLSIHQDGKPKIFESSSLGEMSSNASPWGSVRNEYDPSSDELVESNPGDKFSSSFSNVLSTSPRSPPMKGTRSNSMLGTNRLPPLVSLRPPSNTDAWFILNLLSAVPFLTSLSYASTMEVLETARVDAYCKDEIIVPAHRRNKLLCVVWEGTCVEREKGKFSGIGGRSPAPLIPLRGVNLQVSGLAFWHAGDWTGPIALQPDKRLSGASKHGDTHDIVAMSQEGVKVISIEFSSLHAILKSGSRLYCKYLERRYLQQRVTESHNLNTGENSNESLLRQALRTLNVVELLNCNSALRKLSAVQKRHLESLAEGPVYFQQGERLWRAGAPVDKAFILVSGTAVFVPRRRNAGSVGLPIPNRGSARVRHSGSSTMKMNSGDEAELSLGETMHRDAIAAVRELRLPEAEALFDEASSLEDQLDSGGSKHLLLDSIFTRPGASDEECVPTLYSDSHDYAKLSRRLLKRAEIMYRRETGNVERKEGGDFEDESMQFFESFHHDLDGDSSGRSLESSDRFHGVARRRSSRNRFANKVLGLLYSRRAFIGGLVFSRGHFLGDVSKMVAGLLSSDIDSDLFPNSADPHERTYGYGDKGEDSLESPQISLEPVNELNDQDGSKEMAIVHSSTLTAGKEGCVVLVFHKSSLIPFLDEYPGLLLSLLGTQVVV